MFLGAQSGGLNTVNILHFIQAKQIKSIYKNFNRRIRKLECHRKKLAEMPGWKIWYRIFCKQMLESNKAINIFQVRV